MIMALVRLRAWYDHDHDEVVHEEEEEVERGVKLGVEQEEAEVAQGKPSLRLLLVPAYTWLWQEKATVSLYCLPAPATAPECKCCCSAQGQSMLAPSTQHFNCTGLPGLARRWLVAHLRGATLGRKKEHICILASQFMFPTIFNVMHIFTTSCLNPHMTFSVTKTRLIEVWFAEKVVWLFI